MSSASAAEGTPESRRLLEDIQNMVQANILLERKFCAISRDQALLCLCEIPSSLLEFSAEYEGCLDDLGSMPNYEHTLEQWGVFLDDINLATDVGRKFSDDGFVAMEEADAIPRLLFSLEAEHKAECQVPLRGDLCGARQSESGAAPCWLGRGSCGHQVRPRS